MNARGEGIFINRADDSFIILKKMDGENTIF